MFLNFALWVVMLSVLLVSVRVLRGPSWGDRIIAFDFLSVNLVMLFTLMSVKTGYIVMLDAALVLSLLGFLSTVALTRYLLLGRLMVEPTPPAVPINSGPSKAASSVSNDKSNNRDSHSNHNNQPEHQEKRQHEPS